MPTGGSSASAAGALCTPCELGPGSGLVPAVGESPSRSRPSRGQVVGAAGGDRIRRRGSQAVNGTRAGRALRPSPWPTRDRRRRPGGRSTPARPPSPEAVRAGSRSPAPAPGRAAPSPGSARRTRRARAGAPLRVDREQLRDLVVAAAALQHELQHRALIGRQVPRGRTSRAEGSGAPGRDPGRAAPIRRYRGRRWPTRAVHRRARGFDAFYGLELLELAPSRPRGRLVVRTSTSSPSAWSMAASTPPSPRASPRSRRLRSCSAGQGARAACPTSRASCGR